MIEETGSAEFLNLLAAASYLEGLLSEPYYLVDEPGGTVQDLTFDNQETTRAISDLSKLKDPEKVTPDHLARLVEEVMKEKKRRYKALEETDEKVDRQRASYGNLQKELIDRSLVSVVVRFDRGFARDLKGDKTARIQIIADGTDSNTARIALGYAGRMVETYSYNVLKERARISLKGFFEFPSVDLRNRAWFNENLESKNYYIPGIIALMVTVLTLLLSSMSIVREKEIGTIEQLIVSPIKPFELIIGKLAPFAIIALINVSLITLVGTLWFKVPIRGSLLLLFGSTMIYLLTSLGVGLFISTLSSTQQEAAMSMFLFFFPANLLSGFMFPIANMPKIIQYATYLNPLRYYLVILRGVFLKGVGIGILWPEIAALTVMGVCVITFSSLRFHKRLG